ncbi:GntR family transcriptional regulator [Xinfangfangia pollutisoli]|uniref:GntR family transcriptional regulator n=1 Tax=Xinfangfangia pollutisoli TaxID=2865960 RepID=UPI001CD32BF5|nr:GntR family transcriptional regulator [Xinfangfangia pollutisoli]
MTHDTPPQPLAEPPPDVPAEEASDLQIDVARRILQRIRDLGLKPGARLPAADLARSFGVSRSPVTAALELLREKGVVCAAGGRGMQVARDISAESLTDLLPSSAAETLYHRIMSDRAAGLLPQEVSEAELLPRYAVARGMIRKLLMRFAAEGLARRLPGHGWRFVDTLESDADFQASYEFRIIVECAALLTPAFRADPDQIGQLRRAHERVLAAPRGEVPGDEWFRVNASFHETLASWSGNRFLQEAIRQQNNLRQMQEAVYYRVLAPARLQQSCTEHIAILDAVEAGDRDWAAALLRQHLRSAAES